MAARPSRDDFALFNLELANLVRSGLPVAEGLRHIAREVRSAAFRREIARIEQRLLQGVPLSEALAQSPHVFSSYYITLVKAGERSGSLADVLFHLTRYARFQARTLANIKTGMAYPIAVLVIALAILTFICVFLVPRFEELYAGAGARLPGLTMLVVRVSHLLRDDPFETFAGGLAIVFVLYILAKHVFPQLWDRIKLRMPIVGRTSRWSLLVHYCEVVGYMLKQSIPIVEALRIAAATTHNTFASGAFQRLASGVESGGRLSKEMEPLRFFPPSLVWMVSAAEEEERVDEVLRDAAELYMDQMDDWAERFSGIVEPVLILFLGLSIGTIVLALYLPLFKIGDVVR